MESCLLLEPSGHLMALLTQTTTQAVITSDPFLLIMNTLVTKTPVWKDLVLILKDFLHSLNFCSF